MTENQCMHNKKQRNTAFIAVLHLKVTHVCFLEKLFLFILQNLNNYILNLSEYWNKQRFFALDLFSVILLIIR